MSGWTQVVIRNVEYDILLDKPYHENIPAIWQEYSKTIFLNEWLDEEMTSKAAQQVAIRNIPAPPHHCVVTALHQNLPIEFQRTPLLLHL